MLMKLTVKFNLVFLLIFAAGLAIAAYISRDLLQKNARDEVLQNARIMMESALAARTYTSNQVRPLLETQMKYEFRPQSVPAFAATEQFNDLRKKFTDYTYKEATLNPTNLRDRATDWETDVVNQLRQEPDRVEIVGERETPTGRALYLARPIQIKSEACLPCHSTVEAAPKTMIELYGPANGFGWKLNEVVGAQIVSVPMTLPVKRSADTFKVFMISLTAVFAFIFVALNLMLHYIVIWPVTRLSQIADQVSVGKLDAPEFPSKGKDEIAVLAGSFNRMRTSLVEAMEMLEDVL
jgi:protein-histidine pros-kinase